MWPPGSADTVCSRPPVMTQVVDYCNAVFAVSRRYITDISMKIINAQQVFLLSMYVGTMELLLDSSAM